MTTYLKKLDMQNLIINGTDDTPKIEFDVANSSFMISGRSLPEDVISFYGNVLDWLKEFSANPQGDTFILDIKLEYFNTASSKILLDILYILEKMKGQGIQTKVRWHYHHGDDDMIDAGQEYSELVDISFDYLSY